MVIQAVAQLLRHSVRESDVCGRFAGEQFVILMPETTGEDAYDIAENIRTSLMDVSLYEMNNTRITASFGISVFDAANPQTDLVREAEKALYMAKDNGRNQVVIRSALANRSEAV
jgi:diguanylate cyclase (GGDEF)-like protein